MYEDGIVPPGDEPVRVGISSCLLGERVRYNGEHREAPLLIAELTPYVEWVPVCPEVEVGMGVPREAVRLVVQTEVGDGVTTRLRMLGIDSRRDWTDAMDRFCASCAPRLDALAICGYIFKSRSPSCGLQGVEIHTVDDSPSAAGRGLFASAIKAKFPDLPVAEETQLTGSRACREFLETVLEYRRGLS